MSISSKLVVFRAALITRRAARLAARRPPQPADPYNTALTIRMALYAATRRG